MSKFPCGSRVNIASDLSSNLMGTVVGSLYKYNAFYVWIDEYQHHHWLCESILTLIKQKEL